MNTNEKLAVLRAQLAAAERDEREAEDQRAKDIQASWKAATEDRDNWEWIAKPACERSWWNSGYKIELNGLRISTRVKPDVVGKWMMDNNRVQLPNDRDAHWQGMFYYRTDENILTHEGGGTHVLTSVPKLCTDEEWAQLSVGNIPEKFRAKWIGGN